MSGAITPNDLQNAKTDAITYAEVANSRAGGTSDGALIDTTTNRAGDTVDTIQGRLKKLGYLVPIAYAGSIDFSVSDSAKTVQRSDGSIYAPKVSDLPFTTTGTWSGDDENKFYIVFSRPDANYFRLEKVLGSNDSVIDAITGGEIELSVNSVYDTRQYDGNELIDSGMSLLCESITETVADLPTDSFVRGSLNGRYYWFYDGAIYIQTEAGGANAARLVRQYVPETEVTKNIIPSVDIGAILLDYDSKALAPNKLSGFDSFRIYDNSTSADIDTSAKALSNFEKFSSGESYTELTSSRESIHTDKRVISFNNGFCFYVKFTENGTNECCLFSAMENDTNTRRFSLHMNDEGLELFTTAGNWVTLTEDDLRGESHEVALSMDFSTGRVVCAVDGNVVYARAISGVVFFPTNDRLDIGDYPPAAVRSFSGYIKAKIYREFIDADQIANVFNGNPQRKVFKGGEILPKPLPAMPATSERYRGLQTIKVLIIAGQSNAAGRALFSEFSSVDVSNLLQRGNEIKDYNNGVFIYDADSSPRTVRRLRPKFNHNEGGDAGLSKFGAEISYANSAEAKGEQLIIFKVAEGGTALGDSTEWDPNSASAVLYNRLIDGITNLSNDLQELNYQPFYTGMIWAQGERDGSSSFSPSTYYENDLNTLIANVRTTCSNAMDALPEDVMEIMPVVIVAPKVGSSLSANYPNIGDVQSAQQAVAAADDNVTYLDTSGAEYQQDDDIHYNGSGQLQIGSKCFDIIDRH